jgi:hypothetical protein
MVTVAAMMAAAAAVAAAAARARHLLVLTSQGLPLPPATLNTPQAKAPAQMHQALHRVAAVVAAMTSSSRWVQEGSSRVAAVLEAVQEAVGKQAVSQVLSHHQAKVVQAETLVRHTSLLA